MILPDTSAWVEFLRATGSPVHLYLKSLVVSEAPLATNEVIVMEILAGARDDLHLRRLRRLLDGCEFVPLRGLADYEAAAQLYRECRRQGETIRRLVDCLIAVTALSEDIPILHADRDFDALARHSALKIATPPPDEPKPAETMDDRNSEAEDAGSA